MIRKRNLIAPIVLVIFLLSTAFITSAQDNTPIPVLPASTEESSSDLPPPVVGSTEVTVETTQDPESTEAPVSSDIGAEVPELATCPVAVQEAYTATELICTGLASGEACIGNGSVEATFGADVTGINFANPNERVRLTSIDQLTLNSSTAWTVVSGRLELNTINGNPTNADILLFGDITLVDVGRVVASGGTNATVIAQRGMNVRRTPVNDGVVVWQLQAGEQVVVTGRTADQVWARIVIPNDFQGTGWVYAPYLEIDGGLEAVQIVTVNSPIPDLTSPEFGPMQSIELLTAVTGEDCEAGLPDSGFILQSPSGTSSNLVIEVNNAEIEFNGTVLITSPAGEILNVYILEGQAALVTGENDENRVAGGANEILTVGLDVNLQASGPSAAEVYNEEDLGSLPVRLLPRVIAFGIAPVVEEEAAPVSGFVTSTPSSGFGTPAPTSPPATCTLTAPNEVRNIRSGPSTLYETVRVLQANESVQAVGQAIGELNFTWYQTDTGGWLREDAVSLSDGCTSLAVVETPEPPAATATPSGPSLSSSILPAYACGSAPLTASVVSDGSDFSVAIGGTWTASAGTSVTFTTQGGQLRPEFGDFIQLIGEDGAFIAGSGEGRSLQFTFTETRRFSARFSAGNGDLVVMAASC